MATATNLTTGIEYYTDGPQDGQSVSLYVPVLNNQVVNPGGVRWPVSNGSPHDKFEDYYEFVPFEPVPYDPELCRVDDETSGWQLFPARTQLGELVDVPAGHPKGTYRRVENIIRRSKAELKQLARGYADRANGELWPQEPGYDQKVARAKEEIAKLWPQEPGYDQKVARAKEEIAKGNQLQIYRDLLARNDQLTSASFANDARLAQLYAEIDAAGETGPVDFIVSEGWFNGIEP